MEIPPEITGAVIGIVGTALIAIIGFYLSSNRGNRVVLRKVRETSLLKISDLIQTHLSITYKEKQVSTIKLYEFDLINEGYVDIENFEVILEISSKGKNNFLEIQVWDDLWKTTLSNISNGKYFYIIARPYLNAYRRDKKEKLSIQVFTDTELEFQVNGGGKGWHAFYKEKLSRKPNYLLIGINLIILSAMLPIILSGQSIHPFILVILYIFLVFESIFLWSKEQGKS